MSNLEETFLDVDDEKLRKDKTSSINIVTVVSSVLTVSQCYQGG